MIRGLLVLVCSGEERGDRNCQQHAQQQADCREGKGPGHILDLKIDDVLRVKNGSDVKEPERAEGGTQQPSNPNGQRDLLVGHDATNRRGKRLGAERHLM